MKIKINGVEQLESNKVMDSGRFVVYADDKLDYPYNAYRVNPRDATVHVVRYQENPFKITSVQKYPIPTLEIMLDEAEAITRPPIMEEPVRYALHARYISNNSQYMIGRHPGIRVDKIEQRGYRCCLETHQDGSIKMIVSETTPVIILNNKQR